jgi:hypothetical protein
MGLALAGVPHRAGGVAAAMARIADMTASTPAVASKGSKEAAHAAR